MLVVNHPDDAAGRPPSAGQGPGWQRHRPGRMCAVWPAGQYSVLVYLTATMNTADRFLHPDRTS
jgi:hypothetical protein